MAYPLFNQIAYIATNTIFVLYSGENIIKFRYMLDFVGDGSHLTVSRISASQVKMSFNSESAIT
jgi:hypothetical protein